MENNLVTTENLYTYGILLNKKIITLLAMLMIILNANTFATTYYENDVTPPTGSIEVEGNVIDGTKYVDNKNINVTIYATDDKCKKEEISYYLSTSEISKTEVITNWTSLALGDTTTITLPYGKTTHTIYVAFKDLNGNVSIVSTATMQNITYNVNGGTASFTGVSTERKYGMPFVVTNKEVKKEGSFFLGWSTDPQANTPSYKGGDIIPADVTITGNTLYAVYTNDQVKLGDVVKVGDFVNYPASYNNVETDSDGNTAYHNGWRVLNIEDDGTVNLVSAGVPLSYILNESSLQDDLYSATFESTGFIRDLESTFDNEYTNSIRILTKEDIDKIYDKEEIEQTQIETSVTSEEYNNMIALPTRENNYASYVLASLYTDSGNYYAWQVDENGKTNILSIASNEKVGVRPVVSLKPDVLAVDKDVTRAWNIDVYQFMDLIPSVANEPVLGTGMEAVYWTDENGGGESRAPKHTSEMYSYTIGDGKTDSKNSKWANAKTPDGSYWVWIPRYAYKITYYKDSTKLKKSEDKTLYGSVDIIFLKGTSDDEYIDKNGNTKTLPKGYIVHPAFEAMTDIDIANQNNLGKWDTDLTGIWVAKYEASKNTTTSKVVSKPSVAPWTNISVSNIYTNCLNMYSALNSHMMKNSEWGAVAYLTHSAYGRNGNEIGVNQAQSSSYSSTPGYTGAGPGGTSNVYYNSTYKSSYSSYAWNTTQGKKASTTGNIYGVYDISGGAAEYTAAYMAGGKSMYLTGTGTNYGQALGKATDLKTKQVYEGSSTTGTTNYAENIGVYGDTVYETSMDGTLYNSWNGDDSEFINSNYTFFKRGGAYSATSRAGAFGFSMGNGSVNTGVGFRPVLCVEPTN